MTVKKQMETVDLTKDGSLPIPSCGNPAWCGWAIMQQKGCFYAGKCQWKGKKKMEVNRNL